jgi:hypothetical protein
MLLLLSGIAVTSVYIARNTSISTHQSLDVAHAEAAADAAIIDTISRLYSEESNVRPAIDGLDRSAVFDKLTIAVRVSRESGRIDINTGNKDLLSALLKFSGIGERRTKMMIDDLRNRTKGEDSRRAQLRSVDEISSIPSWRFPGVECVFDSLTAYSGASEVSIADAAQPIRQALQYADDKQMAGHHWETKSSTAASIVGDRSVFGDVLRIESDAQLSSDASVRIQWIGRLTGDPKDPMMTLFWGKVYRAPLCTSFLKNSLAQMQKDSE